MGSDDEENLPSGDDSTDEDWGRLIQLAQRTGYYIAVMDDMKSLPHTPNDVAEELKEFRNALQSEVDNPIFDNTSRGPEVMDIMRETIRLIDDGFRDQSGSNND